MMPPRTSRVHRTRPKKDMADVQRINCLRQMPELQDAEKALNAYMGKKICSIFFEMFTKRALKSMLKGNRKRHILKTNHI